MLSHSTECTLAGCQAERNSGHLAADRSGNSRNASNAKTSLPLECIQEQKSTKNDNEVKTTT